ncbi:MAG: fibronectin type III domain-containing protein, partial [Gammaproteobacteria bacterium]|nr:fibronectin type III domain-containing protein [Gammaproteobacteria bacterium]
VREEGTVANLAPRSGRVGAVALARVELFHRVTYDGVEIRQRRSLWDVPRDVGRPSGMTFIGRPPAPPQAPVVVRSGRNEIQETHVAPPAGGSAITGYERQHRQPGGEWSEPTPVAGLTSTISDLDDETEWEVRVRAVSALGAGPWSPPGRKELPDGIASTPVVSPGDDGELLVTFDPSPTERPRAPVLYYNVRFRKVQDGNWSLFQPRLSADGGYRVTGNGTGFRITGLTGVDYAVIVQPVNANGAGPWSAEGRGRRGYDRRLTKLETIHQADDLWFCFAQDVDVARGPVAHDTHNRHYWTGEDVPRMTTSTVLGNFANGLPPSRRLGVPSPARPGVVGPAELTDPDNATYHVWAMTFVTDIGEEGPPSLPSAVVERSPRSGGSAFDQATIHMACEAVGCPQATRKRLYRATGSVTRTSWRLVADMPIAQESYIDEKPDVDLGLELESTDWDPPPKDLKGLKVMANGMGVAFSGRDLYFSVPYQLHAWPGSQSLAFPDEIVALGVMGTSVVVLTKGNPYFVSGSTPASMQQDRIEYPQPCVSKRSVSGFGQTGILYASPDGLVRIGGVASADIVTRTMFSIREWRSRNPERIIGLHHDQAYVALREDGGFALDAQFNGLLEFDTQATSAYASADDDKLYYVVGNEIHEFAPADGSYHRGYWRSGTHRVARPVVYGAAEVFASEYPSALSGGTEVRWQEGVGFTLDGDPTSWIKAMKASSITFAAVDADGDSQADLLDAQEVGTLLVMRTDNAAIAWIVTSNSNRTMGLSRVWGRTLGHRSEAYPSDATVSFVFDHPGVLLEVFGDKTRRSAHFIESERPFRLPPGDPAVDWAFALSGAAEVMEANVGHMADLRR